MKKDNAAYIAIFFAAIIAVILMELFGGPSIHEVANCISLCGDAGVAKVTGRECSCR